jgi:hypothetical protein
MTPDEKLSDWDNSTTLNNTTTISVTMEEITFIKPKILQKLITDIPLIDGQPFVGFNVFDDEHVKESYLVKIRLGYGDDGVQKFTLTLVDSNCQCLSDQDQESDFTYPDCQDLNTAADSDCQGLNTAAVEVLAETSADVEVTC